MNGSNPKKLLIVDDHPIFREGLVQVLSQESGLAICGKASNAATAMELANSMKPDLAIVDISLGGKSGIELLKTLRATNPEIPVLVLSMHDEMLYAERALRAGAMGYLMKGEPVEAVLEAIKKVLSGQLYLSKAMSDSLIKNSIKSSDGHAYPLDGLSDRQLEILELFGHGNSSRAIANKLKLSVKTVETHRENIKQKLGLKSALELTRYAVRWVDQQN